MSSNKDEQSKLYLVDEKKETQLQHYLGEIMQFPLDVQDKIIEEISMLPLCTKGAVADILSYYSSEQTEEEKKATIK